MNSFYTNEELSTLGFKSFGHNVLISKNACIYGANNIVIGNNVRIDDFCILSGRIKIGNNVHIAVYTALFGGNVGIEIDDFSNVSSRVCIYALSDDFSGEYMTNPTIPDKFKNVKEEKVLLNKHTIIGTGCTILPGVTLNEGTALGAMSLCKTSTEPWTIYAGIPAKAIKPRKRNIMKLEEEFLNECN